MLNREILNEINHNNGDYCYYKQFKSNFNDILPDDVDFDDYYDDDDEAKMTTTTIAAANNYYISMIKCDENNKIQHEDCYNYQYKQELLSLEMSDYKNQILLKTKLEKRNARERKRVQQVNFEFQKLRKLLISRNYKLIEPLIENQQTSAISCKNEFKKLMNLSNLNKRVSKVKILRCAIEYIRYLQSILASNQEVELQDNRKNNNNNNDDYNENRMIIHECQISSSSSISSIDNSMQDALSFNSNEGSTSLETTYTTSNNTITNTANYPYFYVSIKLTPIFMPL